MKKGGNAHFAPCFRLFLCEITMQKRCVCGVKWAVLHTKVVVFAAPFMPHHQEKHHFQ